MYRNDAFTHLFTLGICVFNLCLVRPVLHVSDSVFCIITGTNWSSRFIANSQEQIIVLCCLFMLLTVMF